MRGNQVIVRIIDRSRSNVLNQPIQLLGAFWVKRVGCWGVLFRSVSLDIAACYSLFLTISHLTRTWNPLGPNLAILFWCVFLVVDLDVNAHVSLQILLGVIQILFTDLATSLLVVDLLRSVVPLLERCQLRLSGLLNIRIYSLVP